RPLDVVDGVEHEPPAGGDDVDPLPALPVDLLGGAEGQGVLRVDAAAPEGDVAAELLLEPRRIHLGGGALHRVEDVEAGGYEVRDQGIDVAAGMDERLPGRTAVDDVVQAAVEGLIKGAVGFDRDEEPALGAEVRSGEHRDLHRVAEKVDERVEIPFRDGALPLEDLQDVVLPRDGGDIPLLDVADALGVLEERRRDEGDVAKGGAGDHEEGAEVAALLEPALLGAVVREVVFV